MVEGIKNIKVFLSSAAYTLQVVLLPEGAELINLGTEDPEVRYVSRKLWNDMCTLASQPRMIALFEYNKPDVDVFTSENILVLDGLQDIGNIATICRTALATNWMNIVYTDQSAHHHHPKAIRASAGAIAHLNTYRCSLSQTIRKLRESEYQVILTKPSSRNTIGNICMSDSTPKALIIGNEGHGVSREWENYSDVIDVSIPMYHTDKVDSLNAGVSASLLLYKLKGLI